MIKMNIFKRQNNLEQKLLAEKLNSIHDALVHGRTNQARHILEAMLALLESNDYARFYAELADIEANTYNVTRI